MYKKKKGKESKQFYTVAKENKWGCAEKKRNKTVHMMSNIINVYIYKTKHTKHVYK